MPTIGARDVALALIGLLEELIGTGRAAEARAVAVALAWMGMAWLNPPAGGRWDVDADHLEQLVEQLVGKTLGNAALLDPDDARAEGEARVAWLCGRALAMSD